MDQDLDLVKKAQSGDKEALVEIIQKYRVVVTQKARPYYLIGGDQEDLIQEGMIALLNAVWNYKVNRGTTFRTFAALCIENRIKTVVTTANRPKYSPLNQSISLYEPISEEYPEVVLMDQLAAESYPEPDETLIAREAVEHIGEVAKNELSKMEKQVLYYYLKGESHQEIAEEIGRSKKAVDNALQRIRKKV
ncbi:MAG: sigma-70 family RNA polymerase sigma factor [Eubacterium sp.]